ncbi:cytoplasmic protein [Cryptococcus deuterogattii CA1014]|nr:cytoplasmic protein [Cryptococcus deuterogattii CA1014]
MSNPFVWECLGYVYLYAAHSKAHHMQLLSSLPSWSRGPAPSEGVVEKTTESTTNDQAVDGDNDLDAPPPFPMLDSHQRSKPSQSSSDTSPTTKAEPPKRTPVPTLSFAVSPPSPTKGAEEEPSNLNIAIIPDSIPIKDMAPPPSTVKKPNFGIQPGGEDKVKENEKSEVKTKKKKGKVALTPGHSPLDWARLTSSGQNLRGVTSFQRVTPAELKEHNTPDDAWSAFNGMVYNITPYLPFHPGGEEDLMRVAGRDGTRLFMLTHSWVNLDFMLKECLIGMLVRN